MRRKSESLPDACEKASQLSLFSGRRRTLRRYVIGLYRKSAPGHSFFRLRGLMKFAGFQKLSLLNYPDKIACTLFTSGCNLRCPWCHNSGLVRRKTEVFDQEKVFEYLRKRKGLLEGICISGGEPLIQNGLPGFLRSVKELGYFVKLDTNGCFPDRLEELITDRVVDYVAMDIKNVPEKYADTVGLLEVPLSEIFRSVGILRDCGIYYEFRTTVIREFHNSADINAIAEFLQGAEIWYLQPFHDAPEVERRGLHSPTPEEMKIYDSIGNRYLKTMVRK